MTVIMVACCYTCLQEVAVMVTCGCYSYNNMFVAYNNNKALLVVISLTVHSINTVTLELVFQSPH